MSVDSGGAVSVDYSTASFSNCIFTDNTATSAFCCSVKVDVPLLILREQTVMVVVRYLSLVEIPACQIAPSPATLLVRFAVISISPTVPVLT
jgi:hypothetical protein